MEQGEFTGLFCARPQNFAWLLGAGASRSAGLPTASDILWDMKRRYYCQEENQEITRQDFQIDAVKHRIQSYMESKGFPGVGADKEYSTYFEKIFGDDKERQRKYLKAILSEDNVALSVGNRVIGALITSRLCRICFTTNFDSVVEKAVAEVGGQSLMAFHLEGPHAAYQALNNEEYPIYCKLHGDFRYDSLKNLSSDLETQNQALSECLVNAGNRFGFIVTGYSGRDKSVMELLYKVLETNNPFPHGLFWTGIKGSAVSPVVETLLDKARDKGVNAHHIPIETFDAFLLRLWRNIDNKGEGLDERVRKSQLTTVNIPLPNKGTSRQLMRINALPIIALPETCQELTFNNSKGWEDVHKARHGSDGQLILTKTNSILCWGSSDAAKRVFGDELQSIRSFKLPSDIAAPENLQIKGFVEEALCAALVHGKPLLARSSRYSSYVIADPHAEDKTPLDPLFDVVGNESGNIAGLFTQVTEFHPQAEQVAWSEALRISIDIKNGKSWLLIDPDIWIWPPSARRSAANFLDKRRGDRFNKTYNELLDAWARMILGTDQRDTVVLLSAFGQGSDSENPAFKIGSRTAFSRRQSS